MRSNSVWVAAHFFSVHAVALLGCQINEGERYSWEEQRKTALFRVRFCTKGAILNGFVESRLCSS